MDGSEPKDVNAVGDMDSNYVVIRIWSIRDMAFGGNYGLFRQDFIDDGLIRNVEIFVILKVSSFEISCLHEGVAKVSWGRLCFNLLIIENVIVFGHDENVVFSTISHRNQIKDEIIGLWIFTVYFVSRRLQIWVLQRTGLAGIILKVTKVAGHKGLP